MNTGYIYDQRLGNGMYQLKKLQYYDCMRDNMVQREAIMQSEDNPAWSRDDAAA